MASVLDALAAPAPDDTTKKAWWQRLDETWPAKLAQTLVGAAKLPGDVYQGNVAVTDDSGRTNPEVINRAADLAGMVTGGSYALAPAERDAVGMGIKAYHGSPYDFDKFDLSKIGSGEGAQAYGHGLYFAENPQTAQSYRDTLSGVFGPGIDSGALGTVRGTPLTDEHIAILRHFAGDQSLSAEDAAKRLQWRFPELRDTGLSGDGPAHSDLTAAVGKLRDAAKGRIYEVNINADPQQFLDWDKPVGPLGGKIGEDPNRTGKNAYLNLAHGVGNNSPVGYAGASDALRSAGIAGIKYLDQGSRAAGDGSRNYVVFNDKLIDILKKYGMAGLAVPAVAQALSGQEQPQ